jgi:hypothetical protein
MTPAEQDQYMYDYYDIYGYIPNSVRKRTKKKYVDTDKTLTLTNELLMENRGRNAGNE